MKEMFEYWQENVATEEELILPFDKQLDLAIDWQAGYYDYLYEVAKDCLIEINRD